MFFFLLKKEKREVFGSDGKAPACNAGDPGLMPGSGRSPGKRNSNPLQYFSPGKSHGWRSLVGYSPWGCKELDMTEGLYFLSFSFKEKKKLVSDNKEKENGLYLVKSLQHSSYNSVSLWFSESKAITSSSQYIAIQTLFISSNLLSMRDGGRERM